MRLLLRLLTLLLRLLTLLLRLLTLLLRLLLRQPMVLPTNLPTDKFRITPGRETWRFFVNSLFEE